MSLSSSPPETWLEENAPGRDSARRSWGEQLRQAFRGIKIGVRGHWSFFVHFFFAALVVASGIVLHCELLEWCLLVGCIAFVLVTELFHSAIEHILQGLDRTASRRTQPARDIAAGAVLLACIASALICGAILLLRLLVLFPANGDG